MFFFLEFNSFKCLVFPKGPGDGYSKSTCGANDAISALRWMKTYFPVEVTSES